MPVVTDPAFLLMYGLDESGLTAVRVNSGSLGDDQDLTVYQSTGSDGIVPVPDGRGGKAAWFDVVYPSPYASMAGAQRALRGPVSLGSAHLAKPTLPIASATHDFAFGVRFKWIGGETNGPAVNEGQFLFGLANSSSSLFGWGIGFNPDTDANPAAGAQFEIWHGNTSVDVQGANWTTTGAPPTQYILPDIWYRVLVRFYFSVSGYRIKIYLYKESTGTTYTFEYTNVTPLSADYSAAFLAANDVRVQVSYDGGGSANPIAPYCYIDEAWLFDSPMSDSDATSTVAGGFTVPWVEPEYRVADHDTRVSYANEDTAFPAPRQLPIGGLNPQFPPNVQANRLRVKYESYRPGRPTSVRRIDAEFDTIGPSRSRPGNVHKYDDLTLGLIRLTGALPSGALVDVRNFEFSGRGARRRRGYRVRRNVSTEMDNAINAFYSWRDSNDVLYRLYKVGSKLYAETGASAAQLDTGWPQLEAVVGAVLDNRLVLVSGTRRRTWRGDNSVIESFGVTTPAAPTAALAAGTLTGTYYYAYTEYDPTTGDESGPGILVTPVSPAAQGVTLTLAAVSSDTRFSQRRIYRTTAGGSPPDLFLIDTITSATSYTDSGEVDGTTPVGRIVTSDGDLVEYFTGSPPEDFVGCAVHMNRMLYWYGNKLFWTPEYEPQRWTEADSITTDAPIRAVISVGFRAVVLTTHTVEIVETDFIRDGTGIIIPRRTVVSRDVGAAGPWSPVLVRDDELYWLDRRGIYRLVGDKVVKVSGLIDNLFRYLNTGYAGFISGAYNHIRNQVWWSCPFASIQEDNTRLQTTIVLQPGDSPRWSLFQLEASYVAQFDDDLNGIRFGIIDHLGCFKEMESFEGDGAEGNESTTTEDDDGISSISGNTITVTPSPGWTTNEHRGKAVVCRDVDTGDIFYYLITSNGADSLTVVDTPDSSLESGDGFYLGGMRAFIEIAEQDFGTPNKKRVSRLSTQFDDLTQGRFV